MWTSKGQGGSPWHLCALFWEYPTFPVRSTVFSCCPENLENNQPQLSEWGSSEVLEQGRRVWNFLEGRGHSNIERGVCKNLRARSTDILSKGLKQPSFLPPSRNLLINVKQLLSSDYHLLTFRHFLLWHICHIVIFNTLWENLNWFFDTAQ